MEAFKSYHFINRLLKLTEYQVEKKKVHNKLCFYFDAKIEPLFYASFIEIFERKKKCCPINWHNICSYFGCINHEEKIKHAKYLKCLHLQVYYKLKKNANNNY